MHRSSNKCQNRQHMFTPPLSIISLYSVKRRGLTYNPCAKNSDRDLFFKLTHYFVGDITKDALNRAKNALILFAGALMAIFIN